MLSVILGKLPATRGVQMIRRGHGPTRQLQDLNWGAFDHASHAPPIKVFQFQSQMINFLSHPPHMNMHVGIDK